MNYRSARFAAEEAVRARPNGTPAERLERAKSAFCSLAGRFPYRSEVGHMRNTIASAASAPPAANVYWSEVPEGSEVTLVRGCYVVSLPGGTRATAYWNGSDSAAAQRKLDGMVGRATPGGNG